MSTVSENGQSFTPAPLPPLFLAVCSPHGGNNADHLHHINYNRAISPLYQSLEHQGRRVIPLEFKIVGDEYARGRNDLVRQVKDYESANNMRFDYLFWVDDDVVLPQHTILRLLSHNAPIVSGLYFMRKPPYLPVAYRLSTVPEHKQHRYWSVLDYPQGQTMLIDAAGMGCVMIAREVYDKLPEPYYAWRAVDRFEDGSIALKEEDTPLTTGPADHAVDDRTVGEDLYFFGQAKKHGYQLLLDAGVSCGHIGQQVFGEDQFLLNQPFYHRIPAPGKLSILFLPAPSPATWDGNALHNSPLGGSEAMVALIAKELAQRHHHVVYVVAGGSTNEIDGVHYRPASLASQFASAIPWDVVVVSRWVNILPLAGKNRNVKAVVFWSHDLMSWFERKAVYEDANAYVSISPFHANYLFNDRELAERGEGEVSERMIPNCIDWGLFDGYVPLNKRESGKLVWLSNPNRGLMSAVRIFRKLRARWPHLTLHIYGRSAVYGWKPGDAGHEDPFLPDPDEPGVVLHDPLPRPELAKELTTAWAMFYPTTWGETFSLAVLEAQAAGTPVIANPYGALADTVRGGILTWDFEAAVEQLMNENEWERLSFKGREVGRELSSEVVGRQWDAMLREEVSLWQG